MVSFYQFTLDCQAVFIEPAPTWFRLGVPYLNQQNFDGVANSPVKARRGRGSERTSLL
jgi:hypothetical protein